MRLTSKNPKLICITKNCSSHFIINSKNKWHIILKKKQDKKNNNKQGKPLYYIFLKRKKKERLKRLLHTPASWHTSIPRNYEGEEVWWIGLDTYDDDAHLEVCFWLVLIHPRLFPWFWTEISFSFPSFIKSRMRSDFFFLLYAKLEIETKSEFYFCLFSADLRTSFVDLFVSGMFEGLCMILD